MSSSIPNKVLVGANTQATNGVSQMIKNGQIFSSQVFDLSYTDEVIGFRMPTSEGAKKFLTNLFDVTFKTKVLNEKALASMKARNITPKKQPKELILVMITASSDAVHMVIWLPDALRPKYDILQMVEMTCHGFEGLEMNMINEGQMMAVDYHCQAPFKVKDDFLRQSFDMLKKLGIYQEEDTDDDDDGDMMTLNDL